MTGPTRDLKIIIIIIQDVIILNDTRAKSTNDNRRAITLSGPDSSKRFYSSGWCFLLKKSPGIFIFLRPRILSSRVKLRIARHITDRANHTINAILRRIILPYSGDVHLRAALHTRPIYFYQFKLERRFNIIFIIIFSLQ